MIIISTINVSINPNSIYGRTVNPFNHRVMSIIIVLTCFQHYTKRVCIKRRGLGLGLGLGLG